MLILLKQEMYEKRQKSMPIKQTYNITTTFKDKKY